MWYIMRLNEGGSILIKGLYEAHLPVQDIDRSIAFYKKLGLELASHGKRVTFFWIEKGKSWLGLWECDQVDIPYHPSIRHVAFHVEKEDMKRARKWLGESGIEVREAFGISPECQPLILNNDQHEHAAIYFNDPDGNSLEFISPLRLDTADRLEADTLEEWERIAAENGNKEVFGE